jgi:hypothetical protein
MSAIAIAIEPQHSDYDGSHDGWMQQKVRLFQQLGQIDEVRSVERQDRISDQPTKGGWADVIVTLASTGALTAMLATIRTWILRDKARRVRLSVRKGEQEFVLDAGSVDETTLKSIAEKLSGTL